MKNTQQYPPIPRDAAERKAVFGSFMLNGFSPWRAVYTMDQVNKFCRHVGISLSERRGFEKDFGLA